MCLRKPITIPSNFDRCQNIFELLVKLTAFKEPAVYRLRESHSEVRELKHLLHRIFLGYDGHKSGLQAIFTWLSSGNRRKTSATLQVMSFRSGKICRPLGRFRCIFLSFPSASALPYEGGARKAREFPEPRSCSWRCGRRTTAWPRPRRSAWRRGRTRADSSGDGTDGTETDISAPLHKT